MSRFGKELEIWKTCLQVFWSFLQKVFSFFTRTILDLLPNKVSRWLDRQNTGITKLVKGFNKLLAVCCSVLLAAILFAPLFLILWLLIWIFWK